MKTLLRMVAPFLLAAMIASSAIASDTLNTNFIRPPDSARPWVYWFWLNGNVTREGIHADLEAMKRVGIGGGLIMEVDQGIPVGPVDFMGAKWRELFKYAVDEASRLGLQINMNDDAGWNGSGGPWIKPEQAMQKVVWSETAVPGGARYDETLSQPPTVAGFYRDIAVLAFPTPDEFRIENIEGKSALTRSNTAHDDRPVPPGAVIRRESVLDLSDKMDSSGHLTWEAPEGDWTVVRFGYTPTGATNEPSPATGRGLECDKLSVEGIDAQFNGMMGKLIADVGDKAGKSLIATHIDSWENGSQNWSPRFRDDFKRLRGYDLLPFLPAMTGRVIDSMEVSERFLWDMRMTIAELVADNYAGRMEKLAKAHGMRLSIEAYGGPTDDLTYGGRADEPMGEFWVGGGALETLKEMASAAHVYGKPILGAESFTAGSDERWREFPGSIKALGDMAFANGVSRFVFHRYAMQPWLNRAPGMTMGPWGIHYERTETWWNQTPAWHEYLSRCQYLLRQGRFIADIAYLQPEDAPMGAINHDKDGYDYDLVSSEAVKKMMTVKNGRLVLPSGMSYRVIATPSTTTMTPELIRKLKALSDAGATIVGPRPSKSPSLSDFPNCDAEVSRIANDLWDGGKIQADESPEKALAKKGVLPDFKSDLPLSFIHRSTGDAEIYFVAYRGGQGASAVCDFRVTGARPELWHPDTGRIENPAVYRQVGDIVRMPIRFEPSGSVFVVFRKGSGAGNSVIRFVRNGKDVETMKAKAAPVQVTRALWGPSGDPDHTKDVTAQVQKLLDTGARSFRVADLAEEGDPALNIVKTLRVDYVTQGKTLQVSGTDPEIVAFVSGGDDEPAAHAERSPDGGLTIEAREPGDYALTSQSGATSRFHVSDWRKMIELSGSWKVSFPPNLGAPKSVTLPNLISLSEHPDSGVRFFSGTATYRKTFSLPASALAGDRKWSLDLGDVQVIAQAKLNGKDLGILWKTPYRADVTGILKAGENQLEIRVTNRWANRLIGDENLPADSSRNPDGTLAAWPDWVNSEKPSPTGRIAFTTWNLWRKGEEPMKSGLIGPVSLRSTRVIQLRMPNAK